MYVYVGGNPDVGEVKLVLANPGAYALGTRFVDANLNRIVCGECPELSSPTNFIEPTGCVALPLAFALATE